MMGPLDFGTLLSVSSRALRGRPGSGCGLSWIFRPSCCRTSLPPATPCPALGGIMDFCSSFVFFFFIFCFFRVAPVAYGSPQARALVGAVAAGLHHSSRQCWVLNPLGEARGRTRTLMVPSRIRFCCIMIRTLFSSFFLMIDYIFRTVLGLQKRYKDNRIPIHLLPPQVSRMPLFVGPHLRRFPGWGGRIRAVVTSLSHSRSSAGSELRPRLTPQLTARPDPQPAGRGQGSHLRPRGC